MKTLIEKLRCRHHQRHHPGALDHGPSCRVCALGAGAENYQFPATSELVACALKLADEKDHGQTKPVTTRPAKPVTVEDVAGDAAFWKNVTRFVPKIQVDESDLEQFAMAHGAEGLRKLMQERRFDGLIDVRFSSMIGAVNWAKRTMPKRFQKPLRNLSSHITRLKNKYKKALRTLTVRLSKKRPGVYFDDLVAEATALLDEQMSEILTTLKMYTNAIEQLRDSDYKGVLKRINMFFEQSAMLFHTVDPSLEDGCAEKGTCPTGRQLPTTAFKAGDKYLTNIVAGELSTVPASLGPVGMHSLEVPVDMIDFVFLLMPILAHELFHDIYYDVRGMEKELEVKVWKAIQDEVSSGRITLSSEFTTFGGEQVKTVDLLAKLYVDLLSEIAADVCGGIQMSGPGFLYSVMSSFPAMGMGSTEVTDTARMLWIESEYYVDKKQLSFEPHPVDWLRIRGLAQLVGKLGFAEDAERFAKLADFGAGNKAPEYIDYVHAGGNKDMTLRFSSEDLLKLFPIVCDVLMNEKLECLHGRTMWEMFNWTEERQAKVNSIAKQLEAGKWAMPSGIGSVYATYIGAAAPIAYWNLVKAKVDPVEAAKAVNRNASRMLGTLLKRFERQVA